MVHDDVTIAAVYRACIERNLVRRDQVAPNTFRRLVNTYELLTPETDSTDRRRLAFAKAHANDTSQADTPDPPPRGIPRPADALHRPGQRRPAPGGFSGSRPPRPSKPP